MNTFFVQKYTNIICTIHRYTTILCKLLEKRADRKNVEREKETHRD